MEAVIHHLSRVIAWAVIVIGAIGTVALLLALTAWLIDSIKTSAEFNRAFFDFLVARYRKPRLRNLSLEDPNHCLCEPNGLCCKCGGSSAKECSNPSGGDR